MACLDAATTNIIEQKGKDMARKIITAITGMSLFVGVAMAHAATPATSNLRARTALHAEGSAATPERVAYFGFPAANVATSTQIGIAGIAIGTSGAVSQSSVNQAGGFGNIGVATANAGGFRHGFGGWRRVAMNDAQAPGHADVLFDN
ncbi:hypothetical protein [Sorangium sp. So ce513]|uniref:hypothetical protein n=1 Tax=Sorangium sp. So ce513 TaxID=3133315 RepID=UPI003F602479